MRKHGRRAKGFGNPKSEDGGKVKPQPYVVADDDFEEYDEFLRWKRKHGLRANVRRMARHHRKHFPKDGETDQEKTVRDLKNRVAEK